MKTMIPVEKDECRTIANVKSQDYIDSVNSIEKKIHELNKSVTSFKICDSYKIVLSKCER